MSTQNVEETVPAPATFNYDETITSTQQMLENTLQPESAQQGLPAKSAPVVYTNNANANAYVNWD
jgi:hypothetical protein